MAIDAPSHLRSETRRLVQFLDTGGMAAVPEVIAGLKAAGAARSSHVGAQMADGDDTCVAWYAGQALDVLEGNVWYAVNSLVNCLDKFCPEERP